MFREKNRSRRAVRTRSISLMIILFLSIFMSPVMAANEKYFNTNNNYTIMENKE
jgi:hypothetical protein